MRIGLVLGAGGVVGASWLIGTLAGLQEETGWVAGDAEYIVGTSAGSVVGTLAGSSPPRVANVVLVMAALQAGSCEPGSGRRAAPSHAALRKQSASRMSR